MMSLRRRLVSVALTVFAASVVIFVALEIAPGDVARFMMGVEADPAAVEALRQELGLGGHPVARYFKWIGALLLGDFGTSYTYRVPVAQLLVERMSVSLPLAVGAFLLSLSVAVLGALASVHLKERAVSKLISGAATLGIAIPNFWLAMMLVLLLSVTLSLFPAGGFPGWHSPGAALGALVLPVVALGLPQGAIMLRLLRASLLDVESQDFMRTARAKGLSRWQTLVRHGLPNAFVPLLPILGLQLAFLVAGAVIVETVFYLPGLGRLVLQAVTQRDLITVKAVVMVLVLCVVLISFAVDILAAWLDPRFQAKAQ
ncbi:MAG: ABC transporter permease [Pseudomonadota bacterium]